MRKPERVSRMAKVCADTPARIFRRRERKDKGWRDKREKAVALPIGSINGRGTIERAVTPIAADINQLDAPVASHRAQHIF